MSDDVPTSGPHRDYQVKLEHALSLIRGVKRRIVENPSGCTDGLLQKPSTVIKVPVLWGFSFALISSDGFCPLADVPTECDSDAAISRRASA